MHIVRVIHTGLIGQEQFAVGHVVGIKYIFPYVEPIGGTWFETLDAESLQVGIVAVKLVERDAQGVTEAPNRKYLLSL